MMRRRRSLTQVGGEVERTGDRALAAALAQALDVLPAPEPSRNAAHAPGGDAAGDGAPDDPDRAHVHGFHTYPARMHPETARRLIDAVSRPGAALLDPFCGSGTVLVEARIAGRRALGVDLNPLAVRLAQVKTHPRDAAWRDALVATARAVAAFADDRRTRRAGATRRYPPEDVSAFDPHVLLELDSLRAGIHERAAADPAVRDALELVLSSLLVKVSRRVSDTSAHDAPRRVAAGYPARLFVRRATELSRRLEALAALLPEGAPEVRVTQEDARELRSVGAATVDAIVTSPPYAGTYDYLAHHAMRLRWLGLDARSLEAGEIGARRRYAALGPGGAHQAWDQELRRTLRALSRVCRKGARVAVLLGDSAVHGEALRADAALATAAPETGFALLARASQRRPHFHRPTARAFEDRPRAEHAVILEKK